MHHDFFSFQTNTTGLDYSFYKNTKLDNKTEIQRIPGDASETPQHLVACPNSERTCIIKYDDGSADVLWPTHVEEVPNGVLFINEESGITYWERL